MCTRSCLVAIVHTAVLLSTIEATKGLAKVISIQVEPRIFIWPNLYTDSLASSFLLDLTCLGQTYAFPRVEAHFILHVSKPPPAYIIHHGTKTCI